jgi:hypothetical protein
MKVHQQHKKATKMFVLKQKFLDRQGSGKDAVAEGKNVLAQAKL